MSVFGKEIKVRVWPNPSTAIQLSQHINLGMSTTHETRVFLDPPARTIFRLKSP